VLWRIARVDIHKQPSGNEPDAGIVISGFLFKPMYDSEILYVFYAK